MSIPTGTFNYTGPDSDVGKVRLRIGDTLEQNYSVSDEEITYALSEQSNIDNAAVLAHEWFMARLANDIATSAGGQNLQLNQRYRQHLDHHKRLLARAKKGGVGSCYAGGIDQGRIDTLNDDTNYPQPFAKIGQDDYTQYPDGLDGDC